MKLLFLVLNIFIMKAAVMANKICIQQYCQWTCQVELESNSHCQRQHDIDVEVHWTLRQQTNYLPNRTCPDSFTLQVVEGHVKQDNTVKNVTCNITNACPSGFNFSSTDTECVCPNGYVAGYASAEYKDINEIDTECYPNIEQPTLDEVKEIHNSANSCDGAEYVQLCDKDTFWNKNVKKCSKILY